MAYTYIQTEDLANIQGARRLLYEELFAPLQLPDTMQEQLKIDGNEQYFVALDEQQQVVGVTVLVLDGEHVELHHAATRSSLRGHGIGKQLWKLVREYCIKHHFKRIELVSRNTAISFWESVGFRESSDEWIEREEFVKHGIRHKAMHQVL